MFPSPKYSNFLHLDEPIVRIILYFKDLVSVLSVYGFMFLKLPPNKGEGVVSRAHNSNLYTPPGSAVLPF